MRPTRLHPAPAERAFSLLEIMVAVSIVVIILGVLASMFNDVRRAFRRGQNQVELLESGRATLNLISRALQEMTPAQITNGVNFYSLRQAEFRQGPIPPGNQMRTNELHTVFMLSRDNDSWIGNWFGFLPDEATNGVAALYMRQDRAWWTDLAQVSDSTNAMLLAWTGANSPYHRVVGGVVHFQIKLYEEDGTVLTNAPGQSVAMMDGDLPAFVEIELGLLEPQTLAIYKSMSPTLAAGYLTDRASRVHYLRQRIPIRSEPRIVP